MNNTDDSSEPEEHKPHHKKSKKSTLVVVLVSVLLTASVMAGGFVVATRHKKTVPIVPPAIAAQVSFTIYVPNNAVYSYTDKDITYDVTNKVLTVAVKKGSTEYILNEQSTPDTFSDIPQYYDKLLESMNEYKQFESPSGHVTLTRPKELKGGQTAVLKEKGTLLFIRPSTEVSEDDWRYFFKELTALK